jgi:hypothetical protein
MFELKKCFSETRTIKNKNTLIRYEKKAHGANI